MLITATLTNGQHKSFSTETYPEPTINGIAIVPLPLEENATVTVQCVARQNGQLAITSWGLQYSGQENKEFFDLYNETDPFEVGGELRKNLTIIRITQRLQDLILWCGVGDTLTEPRFQFRFLGWFPVFARFNNMYAVSTHDHTHALTQHSRYRRACSFNFNNVSAVRVSACV